MINILGIINQSIKENWGEIIVGVVLITVLLLTLSMYGMTFEDMNDVFKNDDTKTTHTVEIIYEGMANQFDQLCDGSENLENVCSDLGSGKKAGCNVAKCCVWAKNKNTKECVEGDKDGPMFKEDKNGMKYDEYYYLNKKYKIKQQ